MVTTMDEYNAIPEDKRYEFDMIAVQMGTIAPEILDDQVQKSKKLAWVHSISAGIDGYVSKPAFANSDIPLTNARGAYSEILGEFIALGMLYHTKNLERFMHRKE